VLQARLLEQQTVNVDGKQVGCSLLTVHLHANFIGTNIHTRLASRLASRPLLQTSFNSSAVLLQMNLLELAKEVEKETALHDVGGDEATLATVPGVERVR
jgi:hypothetical protein